MTQSSTEFRTHMWDLCKLIHSHYQEHTCFYYATQVLITGVKRQCLQVVNWLTVRPGHLRWSLSRETPAPSLSSHLGSEFSITSELQMEDNFSWNQQRPFFLTDTMCHSSSGKTVKTTKINEELRAAFGLLHFILTKRLWVNYHYYPTLRWGNWSIRRQVPCYLHRK